MSMDTLEDLAKFVKERLIEITDLHEHCLRLNEESTNESYYEGLLDAYNLINNKINEILTK